MVNHLNQIKMVLMFRDNSGITTVSRNARMSRNVPGMYRCVLLFFCVQAVFVLAGCRNRMMYIYVGVRCDGEGRA